MDFANHWFQAAGGPNPGLIGNSLRFRGAQYLSRTPASAGNRNTWTSSYWFKKAPAETSDAMHTWSSTQFSAASFNGGSTSTLTGGTNTATVFTTTAKYRDPSAWMHIVVRYDTTQSGGNKYRIYLNGEEYTGSWLTDARSGLGTGSMNNTVAHYIGNSAIHGGTTFAFQGYMAEFHHIDGTSLAPTTFAEFNADGVWIPKRVTGVTYSTNGFYLDFSDPANIGADRSGRGNNFTPTGFELANTTSTNYDFMSDTPTNNFATLNPVDSSTQNKPASFKDGNLQVTHRSGTNNYSLTVSTIAFDSDDSDGFYFESIATDYISSSYQSVCLIDAAKTVQSFIGNAPVGSSTGSTFGIGWESTSGYLRNFGSNIAGWDGTTTWTTDGDILMVFVKNNKVYLGKNGTWLKSADPNTESNPAITLSSAYKLKPGTAGRNSGKQSFNFGQRAFNYTPPTGAKTLCTSKLPDATVKDGSEYFNTVTYSGSASNQAITVGFEPDFLWIKRRNGSNDHNLYNSIVGLTGNYLVSNGGGGENGNNNRIVATSSTGFTVGTGSADTNGSGNTYAAWNWKEGATQGFDIVSYTGNGVNGRAIAHSLGATPAFIIVKNRDAGEAWAVWHQGLNSAIKYLTFTTAAAGSASAIFGGGANEQLPDSTNFYVGSNGMVNTNSRNYIAYCFAEVPGFSSFGSYVGNGNADGAFVYCGGGFKPRWIMIKAVTTGEWQIVDTERSPYNVTQSTQTLEAQDAGAESTFTSRYWNGDILSNGWKFRGTQQYNASNRHYIYAAFAEHPFGGANVYPALAR